MLSAYNKCMINIEIYKLQYSIIVIYKMHIDTDCIYVTGIGGNFQGMKFSQKAYRTYAFIYFFTTTINHTVHNLCNIHGTTTKQTGVLSTKFVKISHK